MKCGWGSPRRFRRAAAALVAVTLLPVAFLVASSHAGSSGTATGVSLTAQDANLPYIEALQRSQDSGLFAPFTWNGQTVSGPFVSFDFLPKQGYVVGYFAMNGTQAELLADTIQIVGFAQTADPATAGSTFTATGLGATLVAHDEPTALLEIVTTEPTTVILTLPGLTTNVELSHAATWPAASLSFTLGASNGRVIVGRGTMVANGTTVTAQLGADDYLAFRGVPSFAENPAERTAVLDAFASGRLAAEYDFVAMTGGGWLENSAEYNPSLSMSSNGITFGQAQLTLSGRATRGGLLVLAFDAQTMPSDANHRLVVENNGSAIPEIANPLAALYASPATVGQASFARLSMNATVLVVYLPSLSAASLQIESVAIPSAGLDISTQLAMIAAVLVVSIAAAVMFRSQRA